MVSKLNSYEYEELANIINDGRMKQVIDLKDKALEFAENRDVSNAKNAL